MKQLLPPWRWRWAFQRGLLLVGAHCNGPNCEYVSWTKVIRLWGQPKKRGAALSKAEPTTSANLISPQQEKRE